MLLHNCITYHKNYIPNNTKSVQWSIDHKNVNIQLFQNVISQKHKTTFEPSVYNIPRYLLSIIPIKMVPNLVYTKIFHKFASLDKKHLMMTKFSFTLALVTQWDIIHGHQFTILKICCFPQIFFLNYLTSDVVQLID